MLNENEDNDKVSRIGSLDEIQIDMDSDLSIEAADFAQNVRLGEDVPFNKTPFSIEDELDEIEASDW